MGLPKGVPSFFFKKVSPGFFYVKYFAYICLKLEAMEKSNLSEIRNPEMKLAIIKRTGSESPNPQGLECPFCGAREVYASPAEPNNSNLWSWVIRAFKIDDASECRNCSRWFRC